MACVGHFQKICKDACRGAGAVQETCSSEMFFRFAKMILRDRCSTSYDLASLFRSRRSTSETWTWTGKKSKRVGARQLCTQLSIALEETRSHTLEMIQIFMLSFFCVFFVIFLSFQFCLSFVWSFVLSFFCRFSFVCHFVCCFSVLACYFFCGHLVENLAYLLPFFGKNIEEYRKITQKMTMRQLKKKTFFATWKIVILFVGFLSCGRKFVMQCFVLFCYFSSFLWFWCHFSKIWKISAIGCKHGTKMTNNDKQNDRPKLKWQKNGQQNKWHKKLK